MSSIEREYNIKWQKDLELFMPVYNYFVLEGFINDLYPVPKAEETFTRLGDIELPDVSAYDYYDLPRTIAELYRDKYCVVFYDHTKKSAKIPTPPDVPGPDFDYGTFEIFDRPANQDNVRLFNRLYTSEYEKGYNQEGAKMTANPVARDLLRVRDAIRQYEDNKSDSSMSLKPFLFVLKRVSRYMVNPGRTTEGEYPGFNILFEISQMLEIDSKTVLIVDKMNDLPTWFESENTNHRLKKLYLSNPDSDFKTKYFLNELYSLFTPDYSLLRFDRDADLTDSETDCYNRAAYDALRATFDGDINRFNAFTEGFTVQTLCLFADFLRKNAKDGESYNIKNINEIVQHFKLGHQTNPWASAALAAKISGSGEGSLIDAMQKAILGQPRVLETIHKGLKQAITGVNRIKDNDRRPRAVFFLAGPTGTGKTEIAKLLAREIFGNEERMIRFDMSEFSAEHTDSRLFGAPPGYVGYEAGGELTQAIKQNPFSIILFDEIEKANGRILDKFLQILGDGRLTDGKGETVFFSDSIIIFTSNCGITGVGYPDDGGAKKREVEEGLSAARASGNRADIIAKMVERSYHNGIKANAMDDPVFKGDDGFDKGLFYTYIHAAVKHGVKAFFTNRLARPELLGRIGEDNIVVYNFMTRETALLVSAKTVGDFKRFLAKKYSIELSITDEVQEYINETITSFTVLDLGARGIVMSTENLLKAPLAEYLIASGGTATGSATLYLEEGRIVCR